MQYYNSNILSNVSMFNFLKIHVLTLRIPWVKLPGTIIFNIVTLKHGLQWRSLSHLLKIKNVKIKILNNKNGKNKNVRIKNVKTKNVKMQGFIINN